MTLDLAKLRALAEAATRGPWQWFGNTKMNEVYLATVDRGRRYVMDFVRWGMAGAQPRFQVLIDGRGAGGGVMRSLSDLATGDANAGGRLPILGPKYEASHRKQFTGIGHADAEWIAAANPTAVLSLLDDLARVRRLAEEACELAGVDGPGALRYRLDRAAAIREELSK